MRLAGQIKMGYYPTPPRIVDLIRDRLEFPDKSFTALDPCAGEGEALQQLTADTAAVTFGLEPDGERVDAARANIKTMLHSSLEEASVSNGALSLILLNPPYDAEHEQLTAPGGKKTVRKERAFLRRCLPFLAPTGVLIYIVPRHILDADTVAYLSQRLDALELWDFPEPERSQFAQAVAIGTRSREQRPNAAFTPILDSPPIDAKPAMAVPIANPDVKIFRTSRLDPATLYHAAQNSPLWPMLDPNPNSGRTATAQRRPPLHLRAGHLSLLLAAGCLDGPVGEGPERHLVRGKTAKTIKQTVEVAVNPETGTVTTTTRRRDKYLVALKVLKRDGAILELV